MNDAKSKWRGPAKSKKMIYGLLLAAVAFEVTGDLMFRKWGIERQWPQFVLSLIIYNLGTIAWGVSLLFMEVSTGIVILGVLNVVLVFAGGVVFFHEHVSVMQAVGMLLGVASLILLSWNA